MEPGDSVILTHLRRGALEHVILAMLDGEALYGLDIARRLGADDVLLSGEGTLYPLLARLRKQGLVETTWAESTTGPPRRYYSLPVAVLVEAVAGLDHLPRRPALRAHLRHHPHRHPRPGVLADAGRPRPRAHAGRHRPW